MSHKKSSRAHQPIHHGVSDPVNGRLLADAAAAQRAGRLDEARRLCMNVLQRDAQDPEALHVLGLLEFQAGHHDSAARLVQQAIAANPAADCFYSNLGAILRSQGRMEEAVRALQEAIRLNPNSADAHNNLGLIYLDQEKLEEAEQAIGRALALRPGDAKALNNLGLIKYKQKDLAAAERCFQQALALDADLAHAHNNLGRVHLRNELYGLAEQCFRRAAVIQPEFAEAHMNVGTALYGADPAHAASAIEQYRRALALNPDLVEALSNLGEVLMEQGQSGEARRLLERAVARKPSFAEARWGLSLLQLREGDFASGWRNFEARREIDRIAPRQFPQRLWRGEPLNGARILIHAEQGLGDILQFLRYIPMVAAAGGKVVFDSSIRLERLARSLPGIAEYVTDSNPGQPCDWQCPLMSLPLVFATRLDSIPGTAPYLTVPEEARSKANQLTWPSAGLRVGFAWTGSPLHRRNKIRSMPIRQWLPLFDVPGTQFFSLQMGHTVAELGELGGAIVDLSQATGDMADTAAQMEHLDLVITVDTSVAHLAGALGKPCWVLLAHVADWRWLSGRTDSPWYPSLRLYRQPRVGDWESVAREVAADLRRVVDGDGRLVSAQTEESESDGGDRQAFQFGDGAAEALRRTEVIARGETDIDRWSAPEQLDSAWDGRARRAAAYVPAGATVLGLGCGKIALERFLPDACRYVPCDIVARDRRIVHCDLNQRVYPDSAAERASLVSLLGVIEYVYQPQALFEHIRKWNRPILLSYCATDALGDIAKRQALGWVNHLSCAEMRQMATAAGFSVQCADRIDGIQWIFRLVPQRPCLPGTQRVGVLSFRHTGNFGDRLGYHLLNQILPPHAEVTHLPMGRPLELARCQFDLLIVGMGNSVFGHYLDDSFLRLVEQSRVAIGIFGTQYHDSMPRSALDRLIGSLDHWYARHEEDVLRYGDGHDNVSHLGDWLIQAFPMSRPTKPERLDIGDEIWNDLPLDRTIHAIQQHAVVFSTRVHPLLCALTSAERVGYREQRESGSGAVSGKFRSMFLDIFGRDFGEEQLFPVDREQVQRYKTEVDSRISQMRQDIASILARD